MEQLAFLQEDLSEVSRMAAEEGGIVGFSQTDLMSRTIPYRARLNRLLSRYGELKGVDKSFMWETFTLNEAGWKFVREGGFEGRKKAEERKQTGEFWRRVSMLLEVPAKAASVLADIFSFFKIIFISIVLLSCL